MISTEMDVPNNEWISYVNPRAGEIVTVTHEDRRLVKDEDLDERRPVSTPLAAKMTRPRAEECRVSVGAQLTATAPE
jgi:hypothetical protein